MRGFSILPALIIVIFPIAVMGSEDYPLEDESYIKERVQAHRQVLVGSDFPKIYALWLEASLVRKNFELASVSRLSASHLRKTMIDDFDIDELSRAASANVESELCTRLNCTT